MKNDYEYLLHAFSYQATLRFSLLFTKWAVVTSLAECASCSPLLLLLNSFSCQLFLGF